MNTIRLLPVVLAFTLSLPAGWCSAVCPTEMADAAPVKALCCHTKEARQPARSGKTPVCPQGAECCCARDAVPPQKAVQHPDHLTAGLPFATCDHSAACVPAAPAGIAPSFGPTGLRLHALRCVWRC